MRIAKPPIILKKFNLLKNKVNFCTSLFTGIRSFRWLRYFIDRPDLYFLKSRLIITDFSHSPRKTRLRLTVSFQPRLPNLTFVRILKSAPSERDKFGGAMNRPDWYKITRPTRSNQTQNRVRQISLNTDKPKVPFFKKCWRNNLYFCQALPMAKVSNPTYLQNRNILLEKKKLPEKTRTDAITLLLLSGRRL